MRFKVREKGPLLVALCASLLCSGPAGAQSGEAANGVGTQFELTFWQSVDGSDDPGLYEAYLSKYPDGTFSALARAKIAALRRPPAAAPIASPVAVPPVAPVAPVAPPRVIPVPQAVPVAVPAPLPAPVPAPLPVPPQPPALVENATLQTVSTPAQPVSTPALPPSNAPRPVVAEAGSQPSTLGALLAALAHTQEASPAAPAPAPAATPAAGYAVPAQQPIAVGPLSAGFALPVRPQMVAVPTIAFPPSFCSADARNAFHDGTYRPAVEAAKRNNDAAVAYMKLIQSNYDSYQLSNDSNSMNALAAEARSWQPIAADAYTVQAALVRQFDSLMAVPIVPCGAPK